MTWLRYIFYFLGVALVTLILTQLEISFPGSSEYSPLEIIQPFILGICGLLMAWVAQYCPSQRPIALPFAGVAFAFLLGELGYFMDRYLIRNLWQVMIAVAAAVIITYVYRQRRRMKIAWARVWPSPGMALLFAGALVEFAFVTLVGQEALWQAILGASYVAVAKLAAQEFFELLGYLLWLIATIEYVIQAKAIAYREPQPAARRRRQRRRHDATGEF
jgi:hypothetical protein